MRVTVVGCGSAFGDGNRFQSCFRLDGAGGTLAVDFGATALMGWKALDFSTNDVDAVVLSHLHGDHFGGLPFLILEAEYVARRTKPLTIIGPPGTRDRLLTLFEVNYPDMVTTPRPYVWSIEELQPGATTEAAGFRIASTAVDHPSGAPSTALRISQDDRVFAYSGDTAWTDRLVDVSAGADLFVLECTSGFGPMPGHIDWPSLAPRLSSLTAKTTLLTHLGGPALSRAAEMEAAGVNVARDGLVFDL